MAYFKFSPEFKVDKPIVAFTSNVATPYSVTLHASDIGLNYGEYPDIGRKSFPAGHFICKAIKNDQTIYRLLPRAEITGFSTQNNTVTLKQEYVFAWGLDNNKDFVILQFERATGAKSVFIDPQNNNAEITYTVTSLNHYARQVTLNTNSGFPTTFDTSKQYVLCRKEFKEINDNVLGVHEHTVDLTDIPSCTLAVVSKAVGVYKNNLPYIDPELVTYFRDTLNIRESF